MPFWPQLPNRGRAELMVPQALGALALKLGPPEADGTMSLPALDRDAIEDGLDVAPVGLEHYTGGGFIAFRQAMRDGAFHRAVAVKGQLCGPVTLTRQLLFAGEPVWNDKVLTDAVAELLIRNAVWQIDQLSEFGLPVVFVLDEPGVSIGATTPIEVARRRDILTTTIDELRTAGAIVGVHSCDPSGSLLVRSVGPDVLSFDAWTSDLAAMLERDNAEHGPVVFAGLAGPRADGVVPSVVDATRRWQTADSDAFALARRTVVTSPCGLASVTSEVAERSFSLAAELAGSMRRWLVEPSGGLDNASS